jgi:rhamnosyltransferase
MHNSVIAVIVSYNPKIRRFKRVIESVSKQVRKIIIVDNNSLNINELRLLIKNLAISHKPVLIRLNKNKGLAKALNVGMNKATHASFILTLDQDTVLHDRAVEYLLYEYEKLPEHIRSKVAILHAKYENVGKRKIDKIIYNHLLLNRKELKRNKKYFVNLYPMNFVIQSGMLIKQSIAKRFKSKTSFFIDQIEREYCARLTSKGYLILESRKKLTDHALGITAKIKGKTIRYENESRLYYLARNSAYLLKKGELPILEYFLDVINLYRKFLIVKGLKKLPLLVKIYVKATIDGLLNKF